jgi:hypothetical protein
MALSATAGRVCLACPDGAQSHWDFTEGVSPHRLSFLLPPDELEVFREERPLLHLNDDTSGLALSEITVITQSDGRKCFSSDVKNSCIAVDIMLDSWGKNREDLCCEL